MSKIQINPQPLICTTPTILVGAMVDGKPNFATFAWCGVANSEPPMVSVAIRPSRYTMKGIKQTSEFSVNIPSTGQAREADYCGTVSGANADKTKVCGFNIFYGNLKNAPLIDQCPVNLECKVEHIIELGTHLLVIGRVEGTHVTDTCFTEGRPDINKIKPFVFTATTPLNYLALGESVGKQFKIGKEPIDKKQ
jgi:flavin reductase (DIM6/NTAB) family NADH-FMN oxidoreductase RutF